MGLLGLPRISTTMGACSSLILILGISTISCLTIQRLVLKSSVLFLMRQ